MVQPFDYTSLGVIEVHGALKQLDPNNNNAGPDKLDAFFLKSVADFVAEPITFLI